ncbi:hypothetical protein GCM10022232_58600 [Streptomyces plumbiresistens]|uniref:Uncharacterized protein n=1 Tax=Streptomyces plumbiresistens TaxID=511811 RepID=A0ABP7SCL0_9ACTN
MPDLALAAVAFEPEAVEQDEQLLRGAGAGIDVDRSVAVIELNVDLVLVRQAHERDSFRSWLTADEVSPDCRGPG